MYLDIFIFHFIFRQVLTGLLCRQQEDGDLPARGADCPGLGQGPDHRQPPQERGIQGYFYAFFLLRQRSL